MASRVVVHVGLPKTGTSFLQNVVSTNRVLLGRRGVQVAARSRAEMFAAALEMSGRSYDWDPVGIDPAAAWRAVRERASGARGVALISSEWLCTTDGDRARSVVAELARPGVQVHVVVTVRDLVRQLPAEWQEGVKHGRLHSFEEFLGSVLEGRGNPALRRRFWSAQDPLDVLDRWAPKLPPERVHVVTAPPAGSPPGLLWQRFAAVLGVEADGVTLPDREINTSLGHLEVELLRRVNRSFPRPGRERAYREVVKRYYAASVLASPDSPRAQLPASYDAAVAARVADWQARLTERGYHVVGDLADLQGHQQVGAPALPVPDLAPEELLARSVEATGVLLEEIDRLRRAAVAGRDPVRSTWARMRGRLPGPLSGRTITHDPTRPEQH